MTKKVMAGLLSVLLLLSVFMSACAELYLNVDAPEDWYERDLFRIVAVDTNRTDAMFLMCGGEAMMVDGGSGRYEPQFYALMEQYGATSFKYLFSSHSDQDHIEGLRYIIAEQVYPVGMFISACDMRYEDNLGFHQRAVKTIRNRGVEYHVTEDGEVFTLGEATLTVLRCNKPWGRNARSATLMVSFGDSRVFLTGDIDSQTMNYFVNQRGAEALQADILKAPHHGLSSIPNAFLDAVNPELCFVTNLQERVPNFQTGVVSHSPDTEVLFCGDADILMETDGVDWYVWQTLNQ